jgi:tol-pal system protein YbgF
MRLLRTAALLGLAVSLASAQKRPDTLSEIYRDLGLLQTDVKGLQGSLEKVAAAVQANADVTLNNAQALAALDALIQQRLAEQQKALAVPLANTNSKVDELSREFIVLREALAELSTQVKRLDTRLTDIKDTIDAKLTPPQAPPSPAITTSGGGAAAPPPGMTAEKLYDAARGDRDKGNNDLALQQFQDFLRWYGNTDLAPRAQYYVGRIQYDQKKFEDALKSFDLVLTQYPETEKTPDAMYMKGATYEEMGDKAKAITEFRLVTKRFPRSESGKLAQERLTELGIKPVTATPPRKKK